MPTFAAITGRCDAIVTKNLRDFPEAAVNRYGIEVQHPDEFLSNHLKLAPGISASRFERYVHD